MIQIQHVHHTFTVGRKGQEKSVPVLKDVSLTVESGEIVTIVGKSGSGKSTLLQLLAGFMQAQQGSIKVNGQEMVGLSEAESAALRLKNFGFIFQNFQLMPSLTVFENIELPLKLQGISPSLRQKKVEEMLKRVQLIDVKEHYPNELSGGQQQRVSIARALVTNAQILLADEPTGSLDSETEQEILALIHKLNEQFGITFVIITHDSEVASIGHKTYRMQDGTLQQEEYQHAL
ncbi:MAG: ABC transporter ATP-binding protein [Lysinibacillus sp.]